MAWGNCVGHNRLDDGTYIHTSKYEDMSTDEEGLHIITHSETHYLCKAEDVDLNALDETKKYLIKGNVDISFLDNVADIIKQKAEEKTQELSKILSDNDLYLEFMGSYIKCAFYKHLGNMIPLQTLCHVGMFQDSYLLGKLGIVDVRYFDRPFGVEFYI